MAGHSLFCCVRDGRPTPPECYVDLAVCEAATSEIADESSSSGRVCQRRRSEASQRVASGSFDSGAFVVCGEGGFGCRLWDAPGAEFLPQKAGTTGGASFAGDVVERPHMIVDITEFMEPREGGVDGLCRETPRQPLADVGLCAADTREDA